MSVILFIGAMREETGPLVSALSARQNGHGDWEAAADGNAAVIACCGVGKVNAAASTQKAILRYRPDYVVNIGIAGSLCRELPLCTVVLCQTSRYHDFDPDTILDRYPPFGRVFGAGETLLRRAQEAVPHCPAVTSCVTGAIVTGDRIVADSEVCRNLAERYGAQCVDMESAAIAHVCRLEDIQFLAVRCLSDFADEDALPEMDRQVHKAAAATVEIARYLLGAL